MSPPGFNRLSRTTQVFQTQTRAETSPPLSRSTHSQSRQLHDSDKRRRRKRRKYDGNELKKQNHAMSPSQSNENPEDLGPLGHLPGFYFDTAKKKYFRLLPGQKFPQKLQQDCSTKNNGSSLPGKDNGDFSVHGCRNIALIWHAYRSGRKVVPVRPLRATSSFSPSEHTRNYFKKTHLSGNFRTDILRAIISSAQNSDKWHTSERLPGTCTGLAVACQGKSPIYLQFNTQTLCKLPMPKCPVRCIPMEIASPVSIFQGQMTISNCGDFLYQGGSLFSFENIDQWLPVDTPEPFPCSCFPVMVDVWTSHENSFFQRGGSRVSCKKITIHYCLACEHTIAVVRLTSTQGSSLERASNSFHCKRGTDFTACCVGPVYSWVGTRRGDILFTKQSKLSRVWFEGKSSRATIASLNIVDNGAQLIVQRLGDDMVAFGIIHDNEISRSVKLQPIRAFKQHVNSHIFLYKPCFDMTSALVVCMGSDAILRAWWRTTGELLIQKPIAPSCSSRVHIRVIGSVRCFPVVVIVAVGNQFQLISLLGNP
eukprot:gene11366-3397_t